MMRLFDREWLQMGAWDELDKRAINVIRGLAIDAVEAARSGHPGLPLGAAPMAYVLWTKHLRHDPADPGWVDRDRFVLSAGHGSMLLYALLHLFGYGLEMDDLRAFRQWGSRTAGHPEAGLAPGVEATTGPLGQGTGIAVGMAIAERSLASRFNRPGYPLFDHRTFALVSDGDLMEGLSGEAASLAGHLGLGKLTLLYDANDVSLDGPTSLSFSEDVGARYEAYGWHVARVAEGDTDLDGIHEALDDARRRTDQPSLILVRTTIGFGAPTKAGSAAAHGAPLGPEEAQRTKQALGLDPEATFAVDDETYGRFRHYTERGSEARSAWAERLEAYRGEFPDQAADLDRALSRQLPENWAEELPSWEPGLALPTRQASSDMLNRLAERVPELIGGGADLATSSKTIIKQDKAFDGASGAGRNLHFGVREHAMGAIANGLSYHGGCRPFVSTFLAFSDYMRAPIRLAALDRLPVVAIWSHDSIGVGEDGPTHQPIEQVASLRLIPKLPVFRPADANETVAAWLWAMQQDGPAAFILTRQAVPVLPGTLELSREGVARGAYVLADAEGGQPDAIVIATGSEVQHAMSAREGLAEEGLRVRVVSMPCWELFEQQEEAYRDQVLPPEVTARVSIEAGVTAGWERWVGERGTMLGLDRFGASAPGPVLMDKLGMTSSHVGEAVRKLVGRS
jgi:transketolase